MRFRSLIALLTTLIILFTCLPVGQSASAASGYDDLNTVQQYFMRVIGSLARYDYYNTDVLASVTLSQAVYESGWARYALPAGGKNLFGIKAYSTWSGKVFDQNEVVLYGSYDEFLLTKGQSYINTVSAWRAYSTWGESVSGHSSLFINESKYAAVIGETDYSKAANAIVDAGYCDDSGYAKTVIRLIEQYGMTEYDDLSADEDGVIGIIASDEQVWLGVGDTYTASVTAYPAEAVPSAVTWESLNPSVATVDDSGVVTALEHGMTLITATLASGREACFIVYVDCNATVIDSDVYIRTSPSADASNNGKIYRGTAVSVLDYNVVTDSSGNEYYKVKGYNSNGSLVNGYASAECIYINIRGVSSISVVSDNVFLEHGDEYTPVVAVAPIDADNSVLEWIIEDESVINRFEGTVCAIGKGTTTLTLRAASGAEKVITFTVGDTIPEKRAIISAHEYLTVRATPESSGASKGRIGFLSEITVTGAPEGLWYPVTGVSTSGNTVSGYAHSAYVRIIEDDATVLKMTVGADIKVYSHPDSSSYSFGTLIEGEEIAAIATDDEDWYHVVGIKNPSNVKAIYGYAQIDGDPNIPDVPIYGQNTYLGRTTTTLRVRSGTGTDYGTVGILDEGTTVSITGESISGWYYLTAVDSEGDTVSGYCSSDYIVLLYDAETTARLNLRSEPSTGSSVVTIIPSGGSVTVVGNASDGWYSVEYGDYTGYCSANYITVKGLIYTEREEEDFGINDSSLSIDGSYLTGVYAGTTAESLLSKFSGTVKILSADGSELTGASLVTTGSVVVAYSDGSVIHSLTLVIRGDVSCDGIISSDDYLMIKRVFLGTYEVNDAALAAALVSGGEKLTVADYIMVKRHVLGSYVI